MNSLLSSVLTEALLGMDDALRELNCYDLNFVTQLRELLIEAQQRAEDEEQGKDSAT